MMRIMAMIRSRREALPSGFTYHHQRSSSCRKNWLRYVGFICATFVVSVSGPLYFLTAKEDNNCEFNFFHSYCFLK